MSQTNSRNALQKRELKLRIAKKHGNYCKICNRSFRFDLLTIDHIIPLAVGGSWHISNLQLACEPCNRDKADTYVDPWSLL